jgi:hypothetical protein
MVAKVPSRAQRGRIQPMLCLPFADRLRIRGTLCVRRLNGAGPKIAEFLTSKRAGSGRVHQATDRPR